MIIPLRLEFSAVTGNFKAKLAANQLLHQALANKILSPIVVSIVRLSKVLVTNFLTQVTQIIINFGATLKNSTFKLKRVLATFGKIGLLLLGHLITLIVTNQPYATMESLKLKKSTGKYCTEGSGGGSVGKVVAFDTRSTWFESSHRQNLY